MSAFDSDFSLGIKRSSVLVTIGQYGNRFLLNRYTWLALFGIACLIVLTGQEVLGALLFVGLICLTLIFCEDILASALPFLLLCVFLCNCYDSYSVFIRYLWMAIPVGLAFTARMTLWRRKLQLGTSFFGLVAVSAALMLGGIGTISPAEYFRPGTLFYTVGLGIGMIGAYLLLKSQLCVTRDYDVTQKFLSLLYIMGLFACFWVISFNWKHMEELLTAKTIPYMQPSNNMSTFLMMALPCPFCFVPKNRWHLLSAVLMLTALILTGSRAGVILGILEFFLCLIVSAVWDKPRRFFYIGSAACLLIILIVGKNVLLQFSVQSELNTLVSQEESRYLLLGRAKDLFLQHPLFGHGLGYTGNHDLYSPVAGAMAWYHMMIPQIAASMGLFGILCYSYQFFMQIWTVIRAVRSAVKEKQAQILTLFLSFFGVLLMSQLNPGLFCPLPYGLLATVIFALIDGNTLLPKNISRVPHT